MEGLNTPAVVEPSVQRLKGLVLGLLVAASVFVYLAHPLLVELYGQEVMIPIYGGVGLVAGAVVYVFVVKAASAGEEA